MTDLTLLERGGTFFPLPAGDKAPPPTAVTGKGTLYKPTQADQESLLVGAENANLGLLLGHGRVRMPNGTWRGVFALDEDNKPAREGTDGKHYGAQSGAATIAALEARLGPLPRTLTSLTPGHGKHRLFWAPPEIVDLPAKILRRDISFGSDCGVEILTEGRYIVYPGSVLSPELAALKGYLPGEYRWEDPSAPIAELPKAWITYLLGLNGGAGVVAESSGGVSPVPLGDPDSAYAKWRIARAEEYLQRAPLSIRGNGGRDVMFRICVYLVWTLRLPTDVAAEILDRIYNPRLIEAGTSAWSVDEPGPNGGCLVERLENARGASRIPLGMIPSETAWNDMQAAGARAPSSSTPAPLERERPLPPFPVTALPTPLRAFVEAESEATQTPLDMSAMLVLGCVSASIAGKVEIELEKGYREPLNLFVVTAALPGERKSGTFADVFAPLRSAEQDAIAMAAPAIAKAKTNRTILEQKIKGVRSEFAGLKRSEQDTNYRDNKVGASAEGGLKLRARLEELEEELRKAEVPNEPQYLADDVTMERLAGLMAEQGGRICIASPEGTVFGIVSGRYSRNGQSSFEVLLKGHAGDALRIDRQSKDRPSVHLPKPCLTLALAVQPSVIQGLAANKEMRDLGLLARFLYSLPPSRVGTREIAPGPVPDHVRAAYHGVVGGLARIPVPGTAAMLFLSDGARDLHRAFRRELEPRLHPKTGDLAEVADWANKLPGAIGRVAGVLHCAGNAKGEIPNEVGADTMAAALEIGRYLLDHALVAFGRMAEGELEGDARAVLDWVKRSERPVVTMPDVMRHMSPRSVARSKERRERAVQELVDEGLLVPDGARGWRLAR